MNHPYKNHDETEVKVKKEIYKKLEKMSYLKVKPKNKDPIYGSKNW